MDPASLQVSPDGGPSTNNILVEKNMGKEANLLFTFLVGMPFWGLGEHEALIIALFHYVVSLRNRRGP